MGWLDEFFQQLGIQWNGSSVESYGALNFVGSGFTVSPDPANGRANIELNVDVAGTPAATPDTIVKRDDSAAAAFGGLTSPNLETAGDLAVGVGSGHVLIFGDGTEAARLVPDSDGAASFLFGSATTPLFGQTKRAGVGAHAGSALALRGQTGQDQDGTNDNNAGGDVQIIGGDGGIGGGGATAVNGGIDFRAGGLSLGRMSLFAGAAGLFQPGTKPGTGAASGTQLALLGGQGQAVASGTSNSGADLILGGGPVGIGGSGGSPGQIALTTDTKINAGKKLNFTTAIHVQDGGVDVLSSASGASLLAGASSVTLDGGPLVKLKLATGGVHEIDYNGHALISTTVASGFVQETIGDGGASYSGRRWLDDQGRDALDFLTDGAGDTKILFGVGTTATIGQAQNTTPGVFVPPDMTIKAASGGLQNGGNNNNAGANLVLEGGDAGTGGGGAAGSRGAATLKSGSVEFSTTEIGVDADTYLSISPAGGSIDDAPRIVALLAAAIGRHCALAPGAYTIATPIAVPSHTTLVLAPGVVLQSTMANTGGGGFANSVFFATKANSGSANNLTADAVQGTNTISVTSAVAVGSVIMIGFAAGGNQQQMATVLASSGSGPYVLTLDEDILYSYWTTANGAYCYTFTPPAHIRIVGNGARVYGTGDRVCEFAFARDVHVDGLIVDQKLGNGVDGFKNILFSFDIGCRDCSYSRIRADGGGGYLSGVTALSGFGSESNNRCLFNHLIGENFTGAGNVSGLGVYDSRYCDFEMVTMRNCGTGVYVGANDANGVDGARGINFRGLKTQNCATGSQFDKTSRASIIGHNSIGDGTVVSQLGAANVQISQFYWQAPLAGSWNGWLALYGEMDISDGVFDMTSASGIKAICDWGSASTGTLRMDRARTIAGNYGLYLEDGIAQRVILGDACDLSSVVTAGVHKGTSSLLNFGSLTANGASNVLVPAACKTGDSVRLIQTSGTPHTLPVLVSVGSSTFTVVSTAGDSNTYDWKIVKGGP